MKDGPDIARIARLIGDPARANMLAALMAGHALTARELAEEAGVTPATASSHLAQLTDGGLLSLRKQGRHRYYALSGADVAAVLKSLMTLGAQGPARTRPGPRDPALRRARVCYNHLAGDMGIALFDSLIGAGHLLDRDGSVVLTEAGRDNLTDFGIDFAGLDAKRSPLCRPCLDWSARRHHLAGSLGRALLTRIEDLGWARRIPDSRAVDFTPHGLRAFSIRFPAPVRP